MVGWLKILDKWFEVRRKPGFIINVSWCCFGWEVVVNGNRKRRVKSWCLGIRRRCSLGFRPILSSVAWHLVGMFTTCFKPLRRHITLVSNLLKSPKMAAPAPGYLASRWSTVEDMCSIRSKSWGDAGGWYTTHNINPVRGRGRRGGWAHAHKTSSSASQSNSGFGCQCHVYSATPPQWLKHPRNKQLWRTLSRNKTYKTR